VPTGTAKAYSLTLLELLESAGTNTAKVVDAEGASDKPGPTPSPTPRVSTPKRT